MKHFFILSASILMLACSEQEELQQDNNIQLRNGNHSTVATISRNKETKAASLSIDTDKKWILFAGTAVEAIEHTPILRGNGSGTFQLNVPGNVRSYFMLKTNGEQLILSETHLPMAGGYNFRDLGGIKTRDGRTVKWGKIIRSDEMNMLTDADLNYLSSIPLISVVDFRSDSERSAAPDRNPSSVQQNYSYAINPGNISSMDSLFYLSESQLDTLMMEMNILFVTDQYIIDQYKDFFSLLQNEDKIPLLFHCTAGKDRTGMGAALILYALGVDENTIIENYLASNIYLEEKYADYIELYPNLRALFGVKREFLEAGLQHIKDEYGTVERFLEDVLEVDIRAFRNMYLY